MKALTINQPYAELIVLGEKRVENRGWSTPYRGPVLIHAGKSAIRVTPASKARFPDMQFGVIIGRANLVECIKAPKADQDREIPLGFEWVLDHQYADSSRSWLILSDVARIRRPIQVRGQLWMFDVPDELLSGAEWVPVTRSAA
jgi:hypothetical protein